MNVVLIPCYNRPEFLFSCLEYIQKADGFEDLHYHFAIEHGADPHIDVVISNFPYEKSISRRHKRFTKGNQYNVMEGYREAFTLATSLNSDLIFNIEPDIFISKGFFDFHFKANDLCPDAFYVSACHNQNWGRKIPKYSDKVYYHPSFQSLGLSFNPEIVSEIITHSNEEYYSNPVNYLDKVKFPHSKRVGMHYEQAGLIHRIQEFSGKQGVYPCTPLAFHAGFYGVNRPGDKLTGTVEEKALQIMEMNAEEMNSRAKKYKDIKPIDLSQDCPISLSVLELPEEVEPDSGDKTLTGYDKKWAKKGIKVKSKPRP